MATPTIADMLKYATLQIATEAPYSSDTKTKIHQLNGATTKIIANNRSVWKPSQT